MESDAVASRLNGARLLPARRPDIQGLRAVAVLLVVGFHAGLPLPGGFLGVDVFFVISGFVITSMLDREWSKTGHIDFLNFYWRRFKRLTPALALAVTVTVLVSAVVLSPLGSQQVAAQTGIGAMLLVANFVIAWNTGGYFDAPAESNPLLNTWSLSVEEQFYLLFPFLLLGAWLLARRWQRPSGAMWVLIGVTLGSMGVALLGFSGLSFFGSPALIGFYSTLARAWEFAAGALLALVSSRKSLSLSGRASSLLAWSGSVALLFAVMFVPDEGRNPGPWALLAVSGTALVILAGMGGQNPVSQALSWGPAVRVGDWSYSIYLWHWPFIVIAVYIWPLDAYVPFVALAASMLVAVLCFRYVEQPFRTLRVDSSRMRALLVVTVMVPPVVICASVGVFAEKYWRPQFEMGNRVTAKEGDTDWREFFSLLNSKFYPCENDVIRSNAPRWEEFSRCYQSKSDSPVEFAVLGDSHAEHLFLGLAEAAPETNIAYYIQPSLPIRDDAGMGRILSEVIGDPSIRGVIVTANWADRGSPASGISSTLRELSAAGKEVFITDGVPTFPFHASACKDSKSPFLRISDCSQGEAQFQQRYQDYIDDLKQAVSATPGARLLETAKYFCDTDSCDMNRGNMLLYRDDNHINNQGSRYLGKALVRDNADLFGGSMPQKLTKVGP